MEELIYVDRRNSNCNKWDGQTAMFGEEGLHAMWVADMDFKIPQCVQKALHEYVDFGAIGYYRIPDGYYDAFINWEKKQFNFEVKREWLRFAPGVVAAFNWMIQMLTKKEDAVIVMTPVYYPFLQAVTNNERTLELTGVKRFMKVILPAASPSILAGFVNSLRSSFVMLVFAEMYGGGSGMGYFVKKNSELGVFANTWVGFIFMVIVLVVVMQIFEKVKEQLLKWTID